MDGEQVESLATNALAYRDSCAFPMHKHKEQARAVLEALWHSGYEIVKLPEKETIRPTLDNLAGLVYYFGTEKGFQMAAALLAARRMISGLDRIEEQ